MFLDLVLGELGGAGQVAGGGAVAVHRQPGLHLLLGGDALLAEAGLPGEGHPLPGGEGVLAPCAREASLVERVAKRAHNL